MIQLDIFKELALKHGLDVREVEQACNSSFRFVKDRMVAKDTKPCLLHYLVKFKPKKKYEKCTEDFVGYNKRD